MGQWSETRAQNTSDANEGRFLAAVEMTRLWGYCSSLPLVSGNCVATTAEIKYPAAHK